MGLLREEDRAYLEDLFAKSLVKPVKIVYFTQALNCQFCEDTKMIYEEVASLHSDIHLEVHNFAEEKDLAQQYGIDKVPGAAIVTDEKDYGVRFFGIPSGYEFMSLVEAIVHVSKGTVELEPETIEKLKTITRPVHIEVMVTPTCPYCPRMVMLAHKFAIVSDMIRADMVEATEFPELANKYAVYGVPKTMINGGHGIEGAVPEHVFLDHLMASLEEEGSKIIRP